MWWLLSSIAFATPSDASQALEQVRAATDEPGIVGLAWERGEVVKLGAAGVRREGSPDPLRPDDAVHLGSCTKAMTATLVARLVERGVIAWDTPLSTLLPGFDIHPDLRAVTLIELLSHRAGLRDGSQYQDAAGGRHQVARVALSKPPRFAPGTEFRYSNAGYVVAATALEVVTGERWEELVTREVFAPLGMTGCGFGPPDRASGHRGHRPDGTDNPAAMRPSGGVHCPVEDWARFAAAHAERRADYLPEASWKCLQQPVGGSTYALGWFVGPTKDGSVALTHDGSNLRWYSTIHVRPRERIAVLAVVNAGTSTADEAAHAALRALAPRPVPSDGGPTDR